MVMCGRTSGRHVSVLFNHFYFFAMMMGDKINGQHEPLMRAQDRADMVPLWRTPALCRNKDAQRARRREKMPE